MKRNKAFTLIELMIVISVISLLATVVMYSTSDTRLKAEDAHMKVESNSVATAIQLYKDDHGGQAPYPVNATFKGQMLNENDPDEAKKAAYTESMQKLVTGGYLPEIPTSPDGSNYSYLVTADEKDAVFAVSLNIPSSGSGSNSCEVVGVGGFVPNFRFGERIYESGIQDFFAGCDEAGVEYDKETEVCYNMHGSYDDVCSPIPDMCKGYSINENVEDRICEDYYDYPDQEDLYYQNLCWDNNIFFWDGDPTVICKLNTSVCAGGSNSDYCQCI